MAFHQNEGVGLTFRASEAIPQFALVTLTGSVASDGVPTVELADTGAIAADKTVMQSAKEAVAIGDPVTCIRLGHYSSYTMIASEAIAVGDPVSLEADGNVQTGAGEVIGTALTASGADGDYLTVLPKGNV